MAWGLQSLIANSVYFLGAIPVGIYLKAGFARVLIALFAFALCTSATLHADTPKTPQTDDQKEANALIRLNEFSQASADEDEERARAEARRLRRTDRIQTFFQSNFF